MMTKYSEWKIWNGGECPVAPDTLVQVQVAWEARLSAIKDAPREAKDWSWNWLRGGEGDDIIAYRAVIEPVVTTKVLYLCGTVFAAFKFDGATHTVTVSEIDGEPERIAVVERIVK